MALKKRGNTWHTHFYVDGGRFRQSLETSDWREAQRKERDLIADAKAGKLAATKDDFVRLPFHEAAERFLADRIPHLAARSIQTERERVKPINQRIGDTPVWRVTVEQVRSYIRERKAAGRSNATINRELDVIRGVLKRAKRWHHFSEDIHPLPVRQNIGRALTYEEKVKLLKRASARPEWETVTYAARLALNTTMRGCEIKELRWRDVDMFGHSLAVKKSKTEEQLFLAGAGALMSIAGKTRLSTTLRSRMISELPVPLNSSKITSSMRLPVSISAVAMMVSEPPSSMLRAAPKKRFGRCSALASTPPVSTLPEDGTTVL
jgi:integrase